MASVSVGKDGQKRIQFFASDKTRHSIRLGKVSKAAAQEVAKHIDHLVRCSKTGEDPKAATQEWMLRIQTQWPVVNRKLAKLGLINNGAKPDEVFADFVENYIASRKDVKQGTTKTWSQASQKIRQFFGRNTIKSLTTKDGKDFLRWLKTPKAKGGAGHKGETPSKHLGHVRTFLNEAVDANIISTNPFRKVKASRTPQAGRKRMIATEDVLRVIDAAPDAEMRALIALSFWGGLRTPSEHFVLQWGAIRWEEGMMTVLSPKTEGVGKVSRETPLFPELRPYLLELEEFAEHTNSDDFVIEHRRHFSEANVRNQMYSLCDKAGVQRWPKIFQNLRSTRQTTLERFYPRGTVCAWMGNTEDVAEAHYVQEMEEFRKQAAETPTMEIRSTEDGESHPHKNGQIVAQKVAQSPPEKGRTGRKTETKAITPTVTQTLSLTVSKAKKQVNPDVGFTCLAEVDGNRTLTVSLMKTLGSPKRRLRVSQWASQF